MSVHVLILRTHKSARSVLAKGMLHHWARKRGRDVQAHSAGSAPSSHVNPLAIEALDNAGIDTSAFRTKSRDEFHSPGAPPLSNVITVCNSAAAESCPVLELTRQAIGRRMLQLLGAPLDTLDRTLLGAALKATGHS